MRSVWELLIQSGNTCVRDLNAGERKSQFE